jgi:hypothetical protein
MHGLRPVIASRRSTGPIRTMFGAPGAWVSAVVVEPINES